MQQYATRPQVPCDDHEDDDDENDDDREVKGNAAPRLALVVSRESSGFVCDP